MNFTIFIPLTKEMLQTKNCHDWPFSFQEKVKNLKLSTKDTSCTKDAHIRRAKTKSSRLLSGSKSVTLNFPQRATGLQLIAYEK